MSALRYLQNMATLARRERHLSEAARLAHFGSYECPVDQTGPARDVWSDETHRILGYEPGIIVPSTAAFLQAVHPDDHPDLGRFMALAFADGAGIEYDLRIVRPDGEVRDVHCTAVVCHDSAGRPDRIFGTLHDVTDRLRAERAAHDLGARLAATLDSIPDPFFALDLELRFTFANGAFAALAGVTPSELVGRALPALELAGRPQLMAAIEAQLRDVLASGVPLDRVHHVSGRAYDVRAYPAPLGLSVHIRDTTERHATEQRLLLLETCVEHMRDSVVITESPADRSHTPRIVYVNQTMLDRSGQERSAVLGQAPALLVGPGNAAVLQRLDDAQAAGLPIREEVQIQLPEGRVRWVELDVVPVAGGAEPGRMTHSVATARDITEAKAAASALRVSEERNQLVSKATNDVIWDWDLVLGRVAHSDTMTRTFGHLPADLEAGLAPWIELVHPDDRARVAGIIDPFFTDLEAQTFTIEYRLRRSDGSYAFVLDRAQVIRDANGKPVRLVGCMTDLTARRDDEARIRDQAALLDAARDAILVRDLDDRVTYWNRSAERLYGWTADEARGRRIGELIYRDPTAFRTANLEVLTRGEWHGEIQQVTRTGEDVTIEGRWTLVRGDDGEPKSVLVINTDVTAKKRLELQFLRAQRLESIGTLAGGIAHDLNNVLSPILMAVDLLQLTEPDPQRLEMLGTVAASARRGAEMVRQVLTFARGVEGERVVVCPEHVVRDVKRMLTETLPKDIIVEAVVAPDVWSAVGDSTQLHQVLVNLCVNARDAMPEGGTLRIEVANERFDEHSARLDPNGRVGPFIRFSVSDTGSGMPHAVQRRLFEPFFTTKPQGQGTGLGLATVQAIVKSHGGWVSVYSEPGRGSTFKVYLPADPTATITQRPPAAPHLPRGRGELILLVDDEPMIRMVGRQTLEAFGYKVVVAAEGSEAIAVFVQNLGGVAAVVTDMMMPFMDGVATIRALRRIQPDVRIIATSGLTSSDGVSRAAGVGVPWFLPKPYSAEALLVMLRAAIESGEPASKVAA